MVDLTPKLANPCTLDTLPPDSIYRVVYDHIYLLLLSNQLQRLIVKGILDHTIKFKRKMFLDSGEQLLIYIKGEGRVGKSRIVKVIEIDFILLSRRKELVISAPTSFVVNDIDRSIVYTALGMKLPSQT